MDTAYWHSFQGGLSSEAEAEQTLKNSVSDIGNIHASMIRSMFCFGLVCFTSLCFIGRIKARFTIRKKPFPSTSSHYIPYPLLLFLHSTLQCHPRAALYLLYRTTVLSFLNIQNIYGKGIYPPKQEWFGLPDLGFWPGMSLVIGTLPSLARLQSFPLAVDLAAVGSVSFVGKWDYYNTCMWKTTWKLLLEQYVAACEMNSISCEAHSTSTPHVPAICTWLQQNWQCSVKSCMRRPQPACLPYW